MSDVLYRSEETYAIIFNVMAFCLVQAFLVKPENPLDLIWLGASWCLGVLFARLFVKWWLDRDE